MERRKVLLGSGALFTTLLAGCVGDEDQSGDDENDTTDSEPDDETNGDDGSDGHDDSNGNDDGDKDGGKDEDKEDGKEHEDKEDDEEHEDKEGIPGFDRENFEIDSDVIHVKEVSYHDHRLKIKVMLTTTDQNELAEELQALAPAFENAIRNADAGEFFSNVEEIEFRLYDEDKKSRIAFLLDVRWLQQFMDDDMTSEEFTNEVLDEMDGVTEETDEN
ncbi:hypothetical protein [Halalkalicoccus subterraneus]|uniref:hypothetical protein n=1 Tax=Halalkalicoccus subterraneus TaxID=2675002 RepID=UPI0013CF038A|nr:hypothetical protein [Halalkalicoccus subterraneus]